MLHVQEKKDSNDSVVGGLHNLSLNEEVFYDFSKTMTKYLRLLGGVVDPNIFLILGYYHLHHQDHSKIYISLFLGCIV